MAAPHDRAKSVFLSALDAPEGEARSALVAAACGGDGELRREVDQLLRHHAAASAFLEPGRAPLPETSSLSPAGAAPRPGPGAGHAGSVLAGRYKLVEQIGEGGMGTVWAAQQTEPVRRPVAVKMVRPGMDSKAVLARFEAERQALALMDHPNIARVLDAGEAEDGRPFFVMELVKGVPITRFCDERRMTVRERLELFVPVCRAVQHAHQKGVIHRDLKPSNVLVALYDERPVPKVIDFGVAKAAGQPLTDRTLMTGFGAVVGTPEYMSPEQASFNNLDVDTRSDVYSLGVLLYELLAGAPPFAGAALRQAGLLELLRAVREAEPPRPSARLSAADTPPAVAASRGTEPVRLAASLRGELDWVVMKALEKDRARRYGTAEALARDVQRFLADEAVEARPPTRAYRLRRFARRNRGAILAGAASAALLVAVAALSVWQAAVARHDRDRAVTAQEALAIEKNRVLAAEQVLRVHLTRQMADRVEGDLLRLAAVAEALAATVEQGGGWDEGQYARWMARALEANPDVLGLGIAFEPGDFGPAPYPSTEREPPAPPGAPDPLRDGYSLYVWWRDGAGRRPVAEALKRSYRYRGQPWYKNTLKGTARGWEEPSYDAYGGSTQMVTYTAPLRLHRGCGRKVVGVLCLDVSLAYFRRLGAWLNTSAFGDRSYAFVLSGAGKVISHPHVPPRGGAGAAGPFPDLGEHSRRAWGDAAFAGAAREILARAGDGVGGLTALDPATGRRSQFLYARVRPANWVLVAVIPEDGD